MRREQILMIWVGGFLLAIALYLVGPDRFIDACWNLADTIDAAVRQLADALGALRVCEPPPSSETAWPVGSATFWPFSETA